MSNLFRFCVHSSLPAWFFSLDVELQSHVLQSILHVLHMTVGGGKKWHNKHASNHTDVNHSLFNAVILYSYHSV